MPMVTIDGKEYDFDTLSEEAQNQFKSLPFVDSELARLNAHNAVLQTARIAYSRALQDALHAVNALSGDSITIN